MILKAALLGRDIAQSLSPALHAAAAKAVGGKAVYTLEDTGPEDLDSTIARLASAGLNGWNITAPYKEAVVSHLSSLSPRAKRIGVVNTVVVQGDGALHGDNTDGVGFSSLLGNESFGSALVLGSGGAARAVVDVLHSRGIDIKLFNRTLERAHVMAARLAPEAQVYGLNSLADHMGGAPLLINTTGSAAQAFVAGLPFDHLGESALVVDLSYGEQARLVLSTAESTGCRTQDGLEMLIGQGLAAFEAWTGTRPDPAFVRSELLRTVELQHRD